MAINFVLKIFYIKANRIDDAHISWAVEFQHTIWNLVFVVYYFHCGNISEFLLIVAWARILFEFNQSVNEANKNDVENRIW